MHAQQVRSDHPLSSSHPAHKRVMLVEDDETLRGNYTDLLTDQGFEVYGFDNRSDAMDYFNQVVPDIALLDIGLAADREGGFQLCAELRQRAPMLPIIILTCRSDEADKISGMRLGADDYLTKDTSSDYLIARMRALLRRFDALKDDGQANAEMCAENIDCGSLRINQSKLIAFWRGAPVDLTWTQLWITRELVLRVGEVKSYRKLMRAANLVVEPNTIAAHIKTIRQRFKDLDSNFDCIKTVRGIGYRWVAL